MPVTALTTADFRAQADALFGFGGTERQARTEPGWLTPERIEPLCAFCTTVAEAYADALAAEGVEAAKQSPVTAGP